MFKIIDSSSSSKLGRSNMQEQGISKAELSGRISFKKFICSACDGETLNIQVSNGHISIYLFN